MYHTVDSDASYYLLKNGDKWTVVRKVGTGLNAQARSVMPGDMPDDGGEWTARWNRKGVDYVASWYSYSWARQVYRRKVEAALAV